MLDSYEVWVRSAKEHWLIKMLELRKSRKVAGGLRKS
jgi:hypothetical protein